MMFPAPVWLIALSAGDDVPGAGKARAWQEKRGNKLASKWRVFSATAGPRPHRAGPAPELAAQVLAGVPLAEAYSSRVAAQSGLEVRRAQRRGLAGPPPKSGVGVLAGALLDAAEGAGSVGIPSR